MRTQGRKGGSATNVAACPFCAIVREDAPADILDRTDKYIVFRDTAPQAPMHLLVIPTAHFETLTSFATNSSRKGRKRVGELVRIAAQYGSKLAPQGFRILVNQGEDGHQTIRHVHIHVLGGRQLHWPPG